MIQQIRSKWKQEQDRRRKVRKVLKKGPKGPKGAAEGGELRALAAELRELGEYGAQIDESWLEVNLSSAHKHLIYSRLPHLA